MSDLTECTCSYEYDGFHADTCPLSEARDAVVSEIIRTLESEKAAFLGLEKAFERKAAEAVLRCEALVARVKKLEAIGVTETPVYLGMRDRAEAAEAQAASHLKTGAELADFWQKKAEQAEADL